VPYLQGGPRITAHCNEPPRWIGNLAAGFCACHSKRMREDKFGSERIRKAAEKAGVPTIAIEMDSPEESGAEALSGKSPRMACVPLRVILFDEPDVHGARERISHTLESLVDKHQRPFVPRGSRRGLELYAEGETRQQISNLNLSEALRTFWKGGKQMPTWRSYLCGQQPRDRCGARAIARATRVTPGDPGSAELRSTISSNPFRTGLQRRPVQGLS